MRAVVTGGAGFIGSNIASALLEDGHSVAILDDFSTGRHENLAGLKDDVELCEGDIRDEDLLARVFKGAEVVFHQAALPSVVRSVEEPYASQDINSSGTLKVLLAARDGGVRRVVYASSSAPYGDTPTLPKVETMTPAPLSPYAVAKLAGEYYCRIMGNLYGLDAVALRYFNVFGPRQDPKSHYAAVVPLFVNWVLDGKTVHIDGDGEQSRDFTFVANVVQANLLAATVPAAGGEVFNVGVGESHSLNTLVDLISEITGKEAKRENGPPRPGDVRDSLADISKARDILGYEPKFDLRRGLERTIEFFAKR